MHTYAFDLRQGLWHETEALEEQLLIPLLNSDLDWYALIINRMFHTALNAAGYAELPDETARTRALTATIAMAGGSNAGAGYIMVKTEVLFPKR